VERDAATTGAGRDLEEAAEIVRHSGAGCNNYRSRQETLRKLLQTEYLVNHARIIDVLGFRLQLKKE
jgi:hypothetical protein